MIDTEVYGMIRRRCIEGVSQREVSRQLGISRSTVSKYWDGGKIPFKE